MSDISCTDETHKAFLRITVCDLNEKSRAYERHLGHFETRRVEDKSMKKIRQKKLWGINIQEIRLT